MKPISLEEVFKRNALKPPYFAFEEISEGAQGEIQGQFCSEHPMEAEFGEIAAAEAGRHLAILGSVVAARMLEDKHYFLATKACLRRIASQNQQRVPSNRFKAAAKVLELNRRGVSTRTCLIAEQPLFDMDVYFQILPAKLFERLFENRRLSKPKDDLPAKERSISENGSPYCCLPELRLDETTAERFSASCGPLTASSCAGHFPEFPAWPVAVVMHCLSRLAGRHLHFLQQASPRYLVTAADVTAEHLAFHTDELMLESELTNEPTQNNWIDFKCSARLADKLVGQMDLRLELPNF